MPPLSPSAGRPGGTLRFRIRRTLQGLWLVARQTPGWTALSLALSLAAGLLPAASLWLTKRLVDLLAALLSAPASERSFGPVAGTAALMAGFMLAERLISLLEQIVIQAQSLAFSDYMGDILARKALRIDLVNLETPRFADTLMLARGQAAQRPLGMLRNASSAVRCATSAGIVLAVLWHTAFWLIPLTFLAALPGVWVNLHASRRMRRWQEAHVQEERRSSYLETLTYSPAHAKEVRTYGLGDALLDRWRKTRRALREAQMRLAWQKTSRALLAELSSLTLLAAAMAGMAFLAVRKLAAFSLGDLAVVYRSFSLGRSSLNNLLGNLGSLYEDSLFLERFHDYMAMSESIVRPPRPRPLPPTPVKGLVLDHVTFRYPDRDSDALHDISLSIPPGRHVALVGENGAGKTTLVKLLCRLYDPGAGRILLEDTDLRELDPEELRSRFSILFQDFGRYEMTVAENIMPGQAAGAQDEPRLRRAAEQAGIMPLVTRLPGGFSQQLGRLFDGGVELSAGQWQRLALARVFLRDAPFVILDEPSSALDPRSEYELFQTFHEAMKGRTAILISHRFSTVRMADHIVVLGGGKVVEQGSHDELMARQGVYHDLFNLQAGPYR